MASFYLHGHAICSEDDFIADEQDRIPESLNFPEDKACFQAELAKADLILMGSVAHRMFPNTTRQKRLILTSKSPGFAAGAEEEGCTSFLNPAQMPLRDALNALLPSGGHVAVPGGRRVMEACWPLGFESFHLTRVKGLRLHKGRKLFLDCEKGISAHEALAAHGMRLKEKRPLGALLEIEIYGKA